MEISGEADEREWLMGRETQQGCREERRAGLSRCGGWSIISTQHKGRWGYQLDRKMTVEVDL